MKRLDPAFSAADIPTQYATKTSVFTDESSVIPGPLLSKAPLVGRLEAVLSSCLTYLKSIETDPVFVF